ncbi:MAG: long-chain fatty acid--CoA ligase [Acidimicrobiales bacterium]
MAMMDTQLNAWLLFGNAPRHFADTEVVTRLASGERHAYTYARFGRRTMQLMHALDRLGIDRGERVATLAWNGYRHLECYFAVPCTARVLHTLNLRLSPEDLAYIVGHADDRVVMVDADLVPLLEKVAAAGGLAKVSHIIVLGDDVPASSLSGLVAYEDLLADEPEDYPPLDIPESTPLGMCYTSGTTGRPKGVVYTHRSTFLHSLGASSGMGLRIGPDDCVLPVVPMFHANAWGVPHAATAVGAKQVFLAGALDPGTLADVLADERVTVSAGVPTIWLGLADELARRQARLPALRHLACGGSQPPRSLIERYRREFGIPIVQAWGMTETSPLASMAWPKEKMHDWDDERLGDSVRGQAGLPLPGVIVTIRDDQGAEVPWDGETMGNLLVRGPWVADSYLHGESAEQFTDDGWFRTGDVAVGSPDGYFVIADRTKDLIKSGGEWISSVDMEAAIMAMADVVEAAVIAVPDAQWQERPLACVVPRPGAAVTLQDVHAQLVGAGFAKWQLPDRLELIDEVPKTSVGKFDKKVLRTRFDD